MLLLLSWLVRGRMWQTFLLVPSSFRLSLINQIYLHLIPFKLFILMAAGPNEQDQSTSKLSRHIVLLSEVTLSPIIVVYLVGFFLLKCCNKQVKNVQKTIQPVARGNNRK